MLIWVIFELIEEWFSRCHDTIDFHFGPVESQIINISKLLPKIDGKIQLKPGDYFITKHQNLSNIHVVFHLVYDDNLDLSAQSHLIQGYKSILTLAANFKIKKITIPSELACEENQILENNWKGFLSLTSDRKSNVNLGLSKRFVAILKHTKSILNEIARKQVWTSNFDFDLKNPILLTFTIQPTLHKNLDLDVFKATREYVCELFGCSLKSYK